jgi:tetratricopeptide (TPR) repeat protein
MQAARSLRERPDLVELRAYHQVRGNPGFDAFLALEECARVRTMRGDYDGAIRALLDGVHFARLEMVRGDDDAAQGAAIVFGRKLGEAMIRAHRAEEALGVLFEALNLTAPKEIGRALVLEQIAVAYGERGRPTDAMRQLDEAIRIATDQRDGAIVSRLEGLRSGLEAIAPREALSH